VEAEIKAASVREPLTASHQEDGGRPQTLLCCGIAITLTGEIWKRASIIASSFFFPLRVYYV